MLTILLFTFVMQLLDRIQFDKNDIFEQLGLIGPQWFEDSIELLGHSVQVFYVEG